MAHHRNDSRTFSSSRQRSILPAVAAITIVIGFLLITSVVVVIHYSKSKRQEPQSASPYHQRTVMDQNLWFSGMSLVSEYHSDEPLATARLHGRRLVLDLPDSQMSRDGTGTPCITFGTDRGLRQPLIVVRLDDDKGWRDGEVSGVFVEANCHGPMGVSGLVWMRPWQRLTPQDGVNANRVMVFDRGKLVMPPN